MSNAPTGCVPGGGSSLTENAGEMSNTTPDAAQAKPRYPQTLSRDQQIFLALPTYGAQMTQPFTVSLIELLQTTPFIGQIDFVVNDSLVCRARNTLAARFLASDYQWLLFLDNDLLFKPEHIARLWLHGIKHNRKLVCGLYALKKLAPRFVANWIKGEQPDKDGAVKVHESGTGCMLVHRSVFEEMRDKLPDIAYTVDSNHPNGGKTEWNFFGVGTYKYPNGLVRYLSEDWWFCQKWRDLGGDVWADTKIQIKHMGVMIFPPESKELHEATKAARAMGASDMPSELV